jgi:uncharacterized membrane protein YtjA (UPF0391 family)
LRKGTPQLQQLFAWLQVERLERLASNPGREFHLQAVSPRSLSGGYKTLKHQCRGRFTMFQTAPEWLERLRQKGTIVMLRWAAIFFVIAVIAALFGFTGIAGAAADIAKFLFFLFVAIFVILLLLGIMAGRKIF